MDPAALTKTAASTPASSPGLFSPTTNPLRHPPAPLSDGTPHSSPYLHPLQMHKVRETHKAQVEQDFITGRKLINQYEIIDEIGRGVHGKVKLARSLETGDFVAIKIIQRFSKKRRLGRVTVSPEHKTKREIAILKKIRHPNVVGLLEVIDDPELKKIYMVLEHVELGEIVWRKKGAPQICLYERRRIEREQRGEKDTGDDERYYKLIERRRQRKETQRSKLAHLHHQQGNDFWSLEHGDDDELDHAALSRPTTHDSTQDLSRSYHSNLRSNPGSLVGSRTNSRAPSRASSRAHTPLPTQFDIPALDSDNEEDETPGPLRSNSSNHGSSSALEGTYFGPYSDDPPYRGRSPSMADSIISHMSSVDDIPHDHFEDDYSYVPCFTLDQARSTFRDTVLGLEYLHYEGIVHRDIKPANLLWTRDHRVKISDFGVSYFGRPIREGETEEIISEADATDFDDDLELAKTVGTPAFFAPELCYTDLDVEQPKVTEQIDVWSLGITLYCLIYARLPFLAEDEYQLFRCIAKEEVYIPKKRLKGVDPSCTTPQTATGTTTKRTLSSTIRYREEGELAYEEIDDELCDLLRRMLIKDPAERLKLREVKRHPWVLRNIDNVIGWLDDTDPSRKTSGRRIQVDDRELERAVVPITFLERARSAVKKAVGKVIGVTKSESRSDSSRRRAVSSATSSGTENLQPPPLTPLLRDSRRASLRGDESYFTSISDLQEQREHHREGTGHPLSQSVAASPNFSTDELVSSTPSSAQLSTVGETPTGSTAKQSAGWEPRPAAPDRALSGTASIRTVIHRGHSYSRSVTIAPHSATWEKATKGSGLFTDHKGGIFGGHLWNRRGRDSMADIEETTAGRARSVDRTLFGSGNKHAEPSVAISHATAPGLFDQAADTYCPPTTCSGDLGHSSKEMSFSQVTQSSSTPNVPFAKYAASNLEERPATANRTPEAKTPPRRIYNSTPFALQRAQEQLNRRRKVEADAETSRQVLAKPSAFNTDSPIEPLPPSPGDDIFRINQNEERRIQSYSSVNSNGGESQLTSPSDANSSVSSINLGSRDQFMPSVPSLPSLPALISGASSVSADPEGEMLQRPGVVQIPDAAATAESTPETLTPPLLSKEVSHDEEHVVEVPEDGDAILLSPDTDDEGYNGDGDSSAFAPDHDSDSDSDEGLTMSRKIPASKFSGGESMARRGTNASVGSTDTAKKVS